MSFPLFLYSAKPHLRQSGDRYGRLRPGAARWGEETHLPAMKDAAIHGQESLRGGRLAIGEKLRTEPSRPALEENLGLGELAEPEGAMGAAETAGLAAAKRRPGVGGGSDGVVDADHPGLEPAGQVTRGTRVPGPDTCSQSEVTGVGRGNRRIDVGNAANQNDRAECPCQGSLGLGCFRLENGRSVEPAGPAETRSAGQNAGAGADCILDLPIETLACTRSDHGSDVGCRPGGIAHLQCPGPGRELFGPP